MICDICQKEFHSLGIANHRTACWRKELKRREELIVRFNTQFPVGSKLKWRPDPYSEYIDITVKSEAFIRHNQPLVFFKFTRLIGACSIEERHVKYDS